MSKLQRTKYDVTQRQMQADNLTTDQKVRINFCPELSPNKIFMWECHVDDSTERRYNKILIRYLLI